MLYVILRRLATLVPLMLLVSLIAFLLLELVPGDPAITLAGPDATAEDIDAARQRLGLDQPLLARYWEYVTALAHGDLGTSLFSSLPVWTVISERLPTTISLTLLTMVVAIAVGVSLGVAAGSRVGSRLDRAATFVSSIGIAIPHFWLGIVLISTFALNRQWFPREGYVPLTEDPGQWLVHLILPTVALAAATAAELARQARSAIAEALEQDYIRTAVGKGIRPALVLGKHALKNAAIPIATVAGLQLNRVFGGAVVVEVVFNLHGLGQLTVNSVARRDLPMVQGVIMVSALVIIVSNLLVDLSYRWLDPRVRQT